MRVFFLGAYSEKGRAGLLDSSTAARVTAVTAMIEKAGAKLGSLTYLQGKYDVIADLEVDVVEAEVWVAAASESGLFVKRRQRVVVKAEGDPGTRHRSGRGVVDDGNGPALHARVIRDGGARALRDGLAALRAKLRDVARSVDDAEDDREVRRGVGDRHTVDGVDGDGIDLEEALREGPDGRRDRRDPAERRIWEAEPFARAAGPPGLREDRGADAEAAVAGVVEVDDPPDLEPGVAPDPLR